VGSFGSPNIASNIMKRFIQHDFPDVLRRETINGSRVYRNTETNRTYPSVTSVTGLLNKKSIMEWRKRVGEQEANRISTRAATRGTAVHSLCEDYLNNKQVSPSMFDQEMFNAIKPHLDRIDNISCLETWLYSDHLQVAGTVDCIAEYDGVRSVIDFKTSSKPKRKEYISNYFMQCSAYAVAFEERTGLPVSQIVIIMGVDEQTDASIFYEKRDNWINDFISLREEYKEWKGY